MTTLFITHSVCLDHHPNDGHPECRERLEVILQAIAQPEFDVLKKIQAPKATFDDLLLAHTQNHIDFIFDQMPSGVALNFLDHDTAISSQSGEAALYAVGAVLAATQQVIDGHANNAFCAVRPPGHHAHKTYPSGFCLFNNIAIGALAAIERHGMKRVAIVDFDVHHGNGTQDIMWDNPDVLFISTHQWPLYVTTGTPAETGAHDNILNIPLPAGSDGATMRRAFVEKALPRLQQFDPQMIFVSAGFDAHRDDPLAGLCWETDDFAFLMQELLKAAERHCSGRLVAVLEGGYDLTALRESALTCVRLMMNQKDIA